jgi:PleD family two-component response regulator
MLYVKIQISNDNKVAGLQDKENILKIISNETKKSISDLSVVTPNIYSGIFSKFALTHNADLEDHDAIGDKFVDEKITFLTDLQDQTSKNALRLSESATQAITAIKDKDDTRLSEVLKETQILRHEIEKLKESLFKDALTHVYTRKWLCENLLDVTTQNFKDSGTLAIIDLNYFKIINDTYGHIVGDKVLIYIANQLKKIKEMLSDMVGMNL